jgi:transposase InsO family protein
LGIFSYGETHLNEQKRFKNTTDSKHDLKISPNLLDREFTVTELGRVWVSDITYIRIRNSFVYLTTVIHLTDRMVVGWNLSDNMTDQDTVIAAFKKAVKSRSILPGLMFHSDRGSQYASAEFRKLLDAEKCIQTMVRKSIFISMIISKVIKKDGATNCCTIFKIIYYKNLKLISLHYYHFFDFMKAIFCTYINMIGTISQSTDVYFN